ncbi:hypothetical protein VKT23_005891 [Stygiomarasmius scandens]|uniref:Uncharacterized protein n=1 Tax=Marasmiellus scandens TaxID=2682957 RepID=A0ABR1JV01_9AGAR
MDAEVALQALNAMKNDLVPQNTPSTRPQAIPPSPFAAWDESDPSTQSPSSPFAAQEGSETQSPDVYPVFSAFSVPDVPGAVYLEACLGPDPQNTPIVEFLRQHPATVKVGNIWLDRTSNRHRQRLWLQPIPVPEVGELLNISPPSIKLFTWVKVTRGRYKNDVGFVIRREISTAHRRLAVLLVPRLETEPSTPPLPAPGESKKSHGKWKRQEPERVQRLFARTDWKEGKGKRRWAEVSPNSYHMDGQMFQYDLVLLHLPYALVTDIDVRMDPITRRHFRASQHPQIKHVQLPLPDDWVFYQNEAVDVIMSAPLTEQQRLDHSLPRTTFWKSARIERIDSERCLVHLDEFDDEVPGEYTVETYGVKNLKKKDIEETDVWVTKLNLRKRISIGDHVEAVAGNAKGRFGFVLSNWGQQIAVVEMSSVQKEIGKPFTVDINSCRIVQARNDVTVPWINQRIVVIRGQYQGHFGIVADVSPPLLNGFTMIDVRLWGWEQTVRIRHDNVVETCTNKVLCQVLPLLPHQQGFRQVSWGTAYAPTVARPAFEGGRILQAEEYLFRQQRPPEPWLRKHIMVIKGLIKNKGFVAQLIP